MFVSLDKSYSEEEDKKNEQYQEVFGPPTQPPNKKAKKHNEITVLAESNVTSALD